MLELIFMIGFLVVLLGGKALTTSIGMFMVISSSMTHKLMYPENHKAILVDVPIWFSCIALAICLGTMFYLVAAKRK